MKDRKNGVQFLVHTDMSLSATSSNQLPEPPNLQINGYQNPSLAVNLLKLDALHSATKLLCLRKTRATPPQEIVD